MYKNMQELFKGMKEHTCDRKVYIPSDDPQNDIWDAKVEGRLPKVYPTKGYTCECGEDFRIELREGSSLEGVPQEIQELLKTAAGNRKLCEFFSK
jgi:hypothetical protein